LGNVINSKNKMYFKNINPLENMHGFQTSIFDMDFVFFKKKKKERINSPLIDPLNDSPLID
jgi:hypothetical protein